MVIRRKAWLCGKCLKVHKTKHEAFRCERNCLDKSKAELIFNIFYRLWKEFEGEKGVAGMRYFDKTLERRIITAKEVLDRE